MRKFDTIIVTAGYQTNKDWWHWKTLEDIQACTKLPNEYYLQEEGEDTGDDLLALMERVVPKQRQVFADAFHSNRNNKSKVPETSTRVCILCWPIELKHVAGAVRRFKSKHYPYVEDDDGNIVGDMVFKSTQFKKGNQYEIYGYNNFLWFTRLPILPTMRWEIPTVINIDNEDNP